MEEQEAERGIRTRIQYSRDNFHYLNLRAQETSAAEA